jgi:hypothetical protein
MTTMTMTAQALVGCRVRVVSWNRLDRMTESSQQSSHLSHLDGTATHADDDGHVWVRLEGFERECQFDPDQLELLPGECHVG